MMSRRNPISPAYQQDYERYHLLPLAQTDPTSVLRWSSYLFWNLITWGSAILLGGIAWTIYRDMAGTTTIPQDTRIGLWACTVLSFLLVLAGSALIVSIARSIARWRSFISASQHTRGTIIGKWKQNSVGPDALVDHFLAVQYLNGRYCRVEVTSRQFDKTSIGQPLQIRYLPDHPEVCQAIPDQPKRK